MHTDIAMGTTPSKSDFESCLSTSYKERHHVPGDALSDFLGPHLAVPITDNLMCRDIVLP